MKPDVGQLTGVVRFQTCLASLRNIIRMLRLGRQCRSGTRMKMGGHIVHPLQYRMKIPEVNLNPLFVLLVLLLNP